MRIDHADRRDHVRRRLCETLDRQHHLGGGSETVAAHGHRHGTGVSGATIHDNLEAARAVDRRDDADRLIGALEHRPLLNVNLNETERRGAVQHRVGNPRGITTERDEFFAHRHAGTIAFVERCRFDCSRERARAPQR